VPVYGIGAKGLADGQTPRRSLAEMAVAYNAAIRGKQQRGPYRLAGYSFGGIVAHEMARRLQLDGYEVSLLALIDSYNHPEHWPFTARLAVLRQRLRHRVFLIWRDGVAATLRYVAWRLRRSASRRRDAATGRRVGRFDEQADLPPALRNVRDASELALLDHRPGKFSGRVDFIRAAASLWYPPDPRPIWRDLTAVLTVSTVPGGHFDLAYGEAEGVGRELTILLERPTSATKSSREPFTASKLDEDGEMAARTEIKGRA
jgi:thioesterase domain-containing protein